MRLGKLLWFGGCFWSPEQGASLSTQCSPLFLQSFVLLFSASPVLPKSVTCCHPRACSAPHARMWYVSVNSFFLLNFKIITFCHFTKIGVYAYCKPVLIPQPDSGRTAEQLPSYIHVRRPDPYSVSWWVVKWWVVDEVLSAAHCHDLHSRAAPHPAPQCHGFAPAQPSAPQPSWGAELLCSILPADGDWKLHFEGTATPSYAAARFQKAITHPLQAGLYLLLRPAFLKEGSAVFERAAVLPLELNSQVLCWKPEGTWRTSNKYNLSVQTAVRNGLKRV